MIVPVDDVDTRNMEEAILCVKDCISKSRSETFRGLQDEIEAVLGDRRFDQVRSGCELFTLRITKHLKGVSEKESMATVRRVLEARCQYFHDICSNGPLSIVNDMLPFIRDTSTVLVFGKGPLLANCVASAVEQRPGVKFFFCEASPSNGGRILLERALRNPRGYNNRELLAKSCTIIPDSAVASVMSKVDFVITGANCVTEHGGLVHETGSLQVAMIADALHIPFYVLCETFKFSRIFPLSTSDLKQPVVAAPPAAQQPASASTSSSPGAAADALIVPVVEFVPPSLLSLVFTEQGIMPPSAVADEMFRIHTGREGTNI